MNAFNENNIFIFEDYGFDVDTKLAWFAYKHTDPALSFRETISIETENPVELMKNPIFQKALILAFYVTATSYYKAFPTSNFEFRKAALDEWQSGFLKTVFTEGMSQFWYENQLDPGEKISFESCELGNTSAIKYEGIGNLVLQSGGKDSLLLATLLKNCQQEFQPWYESTTDTYPEVLDSFNKPLVHAKRTLDITDLKIATELGGLNGHVPVTYIVSSHALLQMVASNLKRVLLAIGNEGVEPSNYIGALPVQHQWSKTFSAEKLMQNYIANYISADIEYGSPLRPFHEVKIAQLFLKKAFEKYGTRFSSCNFANYKQGTDNKILYWCGECPKCTNAFLLFAPFLEPNRLEQMLGGNLFKKPELLDMYKGLLGIDGVAKPLECVGETEELRWAYHQSRSQFSEADYSLSFNVPEPSDFNPNILMPHNERLFSLISNCIE
ncbi:hypothetical protein KBC31_03835 [Candidatus Saccharibacteria bacterium]|jgi:hypothetical protein|nr:hypothetical protein [Candidatus Saccharibacteria bacterium]